MDKDCVEDVETQKENDENITVDEKCENNFEGIIENNGVGKEQKDAAINTISREKLNDECLNKCKVEEAPIMPQVECDNIPLSRDSEKTDTASSRHKTVKKQGLSKKIATLQEKTKNLRDKLGIHRNKLQQHATAVTNISEVSLINDTLAEHAMKSLQSNTTNSLNNSIATISVSENNRKLKTEQVQAQYSSRKQLQKKVGDLQEQVEGLHELLNQLTIKNPQLKERVLTLAHRNPKLRQIKLFTASEISASTSRKAQPLLTAKQRKESEVSNASTTTSQKDTTSVNDNASVQKANRKRSQRKRKNKLTKESKNQKSEIESLSKYLNNIVSEYFGPEQKKKADELEFKGTFDDLESYAQTLVQAGIGRIVEEEIRINRKNNRQSFITMSSDREGTERDGIILLPVARRYAFEGDIVRAFVMNMGVGATPTSSPTDTVAKEGRKTEVEGASVTGGKETSLSLDDEDPFEDTESPDSENDAEMDASAIAVPDNCPKSFVISIVKQTPLRELVGTISFKNSMKLNDEISYYKLKPHDMRVPMVYIPESKCSSHITTENQGDVCGMLYLVRVIETDINGHCIGELLQPVGKVGNVEAELKAILLHNGLKNIKPFEQHFNDQYAQPDSPISAADLRFREDWREKCVFTIDPLTARDLDDAVSVESLDDDIYEIGVHISDVAHYLQEDSELDNIVKERATSIYLVNEVIHMLPKTLCFKCSLLPGEDKFAFSVFWRINKHGEIIGQPRFTRTVINSCVQLAYEHAQKVIDNPNEDFGIDDFPTICNGFTVQDICPRIQILNKIAEILRQKRFDGGALSINNPKIRFNLDPITGEALSYELDSRQEANFLIEEFMLLANQSVARFIYDRFPDISILRNHGPPLSKSMKNLREKLLSLGMEFDCSSSKAVYASMQKLCREAKDPEAMDACLSALLTKPMARAKYFCSEGKSEEADLWHYALSIPIYTHFTSPIRRYPDILVHRVLAAALDYCPPPKRSPDELHMLAKICNDQKYNAKNAGDESINLFFKRYIKEKQSITMRAVVTEIFQHLLNVVTIETGHSISINFKMQKVLVDTSNAPAYVLIAERNSKTPPVKLQLFSTIDVKLVIWDDKVCGFFVSPDPQQRQINSIQLSKKKQQQSTSSANNSTSENSGVRK
ncbi:PREDICTED: DIS3-like exonuclease 2 isoform X2 [Bactrocera latifrons]|uniref:DIS3-like exonuclease 2 isoform X2 n=1 Tax=Bactrocera latifrons TaxID=174628 RepID=UPI0008DD1694|nr:PREDICTED: DIS3-like exonuclease 2 isoform X2 [Bactrocera latifrons]